MVMVANKKSQDQMTEDLSLFLGNNTIRFTVWYVSEYLPLRTNFGLSQEQVFCLQRGSWQESQIKPCEVGCERWEHGLWSQTAKVESACFLGFSIHEMGIVNHLYGVVVKIKWANACAYSCAWPIASPQYVLTVVTVSF